MERKQSRVRKMLNAANLSWLDVYSLWKEKAAKEEVGAEAGPPRLAGWAVCDPRASRPQPRSAMGARSSRGMAIASLAASSRGSETARGRSTKGSHAHVAALCVRTAASPPHTLWSPKARGWGLREQAWAAEAPKWWLRCRPRIPGGVGREPPGWRAEH